MHAPRLPVVSTLNRKLSEKLEWDLLMQYFSLAIYSDRGQVLPCALLYYAVLDSTVRLYRSALHSVVCYRRYGCGLT
jgi:hypothetical protein